MRAFDTDHISLIARGGEEGKRIVGKASAFPASEFGVTIINYEEQMRGWLSEINAAKSVAQQEFRYAELHRMLRYYCATPILPFDDKAIAVFQNLWISRIRIGTTDLKIASIAIANDATLLTRNAKDFSKVPGLKFED